MNINETLYVKFLQAPHLPHRKFKKKKKRKRKFPSFPVSLWLFKVTREVFLFPNRIQWCFSPLPLLLNHVYYWKNEVSKSRTGWYQYHRPLAVYLIFIFSFFPTCRVRILLGQQSIKLNTSQVLLPLELDSWCNLANKTLQEIFLENFWIQAFLFSLPYHSPSCLLES